MWACVCPIFPQFAKAWFLFSNKNRDELILALRHCVASAPPRHTSPTPACARACMHAHSSRMHDAHCATTNQRLVVVVDASAQCAAKETSLFAPRAPPTHAQVSALSSPFFVASLWQWCIRLAACARRAGASAGGRAQQPARLLTPRLCFGTRVLHRFIHDSTSSTMSRYTLDWSFGYATLWNLPNTRATPGPAKRAGTLALSAVSTPSPSP